MSDSQRIAYYVRGYPGPPGSGVTAEELQAIQSDLVMLKDTTWRGTPTVVAKSLPQPSSGNRADLGIIPGFPLITVEDLDSGVAHLIEMVGRVKVTTTIDMIASVAARLGGVAWGTVESTPNDTGTFWLSCSLVRVLPAGNGSFSATLHYETSTATNVTFQEAQLEVRAVPRAD